MRRASEPTKMNPELDRGRRVSRRHWRERFPILLSLVL
jgi:hypothetical protein